MEEFKVTGGARIGKANATWPFATLKASREKLELNASILGNLVFRPGDIVSLEPHVQIPFLGQGIKINHRVDNYKKLVIFWTFSDPERLIIRIKQTGLLSNTNDLRPSLESEIKTSQKSGSNPIKKSAIIAIIAIWNILFLVDFSRLADIDLGIRPGLGIQMALGFVFATALLLLIFEPIRHLILKEGRRIEEIKTFLFFIMFVTGFMLFAFSQVPITDILLQ